MNILETLRRNRWWLLLLILVLGVVLFTLEANKEAGIDTAPEGTDTDFSTRANIVDGAELLQNIGSVYSYDLLAQDLYVFGKQNYKDYQDKPDGVIGFRVAPTIKKEGKTLTFEGNYGASENKIQSTVKILKYGRISVTIMDTKTKLSIDSTLPSNNKRDQFIGGLPLSTNAYMIDYLPTSDSFIITLYSGTRKQAEKALTSGLGVTDIPAEKIKVIIPASSGEGEGIPPG